MRNRPQRLASILIMLAAAALPALAPARAAEQEVAPEAAVSQVAASNSALQADAERVLVLIGRSDALRGKIPRFVEEADAAIEAHKGALPAAYSVRIAKEMAEANAIRADLFQLALRYRNALYRVDERLGDDDRIDSILVSMAAAVALFDNTQFMQQHFSARHVLRDKLNEAYPEFGVGRNFYEDALLRANSLPYRTAMNDAIRFFENNQAEIAAHVGRADRKVRAVYDFLAHSPARARFGGGDAFRQISDQVAILLERSVIDSARQVGKLKFLTSQVVGNTLGLVRWRTGKLHGDAEFLAVLGKVLQPGDILLEKTPFALTDKTIPGHFGHAAIYVGTSEQLRAAGALELPLVQAHRVEIDDGRVVLEALRGGVVLNSLQHFMNIDDIAVLRPRRLGAEELRESLNLALENFGKRYDFNFDVNTTETIVCSELVYAAYPQIDFVTKQVFTSFTIAPDDIARQAGGNASDALELALFGHDGKLVYRQGQDVAGLALYRKLVGLTDGQTPTALNQTRGVAAR